MPCIAFRSGSDVYLVNHRSLLFRIAKGAPYLSVTALKRRTEREGLQRVRPVNEGREARPWVTVGFGWLEAELVAGE